MCKSESCRISLSRILVPHELLSDDGCSQLDFFVINSSSIVFFLNEVPSFTCIIVDDALTRPSACPASERERCPHVPGKDARILGYQHAFAG